MPPIPSIVEGASHAIPLRENGDALVPLTGEEPHGIRVYPEYFLQKIPGAEEALRTREGVRDRLRAAAAALPPGIALVVFDAFRPLAVQAWLWTEFFTRVHHAHPHLTGDALTDYVSQFVASPDPDPAFPPPHRTGGAVDLYLVERASGAPLPMGTAPDAAVPESETDWFERHPQEPFRQNRRLLYHTLTRVGFANYPGEWWHFEYGTRRWAGQTGAAEALYGDAETQLWEI
jgi:D-alanyl-D-alanine dipeptidase